MHTYSTFRPTGFDTAGLALDDRQDWLVLPCSRNRDSDCLAESNFAAALKSLGGEGADVEVHRFGHWACGWFEVIIVRPCSEAEKEATRIEDALEDYPILDESDHSERELAEADRVWEQYRVSGLSQEASRIEYIREHRSQFEFHDMTDLMGCVRGKYFAGYASELLG